MIDQIKSILKQSIEAKQRVLADTDLQKQLESVVKACVDTLSTGGKILFCGNGGSAADAQHLAAELSGSFYKDREPLFAEALHVNTSYLTAVANDYGYDEVYARLVKAKGRKGDVLIGLSTSGNSPNVVNAFEAARSLDILTVGMTGKTGGKLKPLCDYLINVPSTDTPRIQEVHITVGHIVCELVESAIFS